ncbi:hypothetical protein [Paenibacillus silvisoli]|uniref:hypothetical protein n=1 Tax=Paenibacillus silvisoli TaxID=3110539 RepID=UPI0028039AE2|nr:hypothetical protein [Paenibacillus silvisoli]
MNTTFDALIKQAYAKPAVRAHLVHSGMMSLYCDFSGTERHIHGVACAIVFNRTVRVQAARLEHPYSLGSDYGELQAIRFSLELLASELAEERPNQAAPRSAAVFTDCRNASRLLAERDFAASADAASFSDDSRYDDACQAIRAQLEQLKLDHPRMSFSINYLHRGKEGNALHRMAHNAARACTDPQG